MSFLIGALGSLTVLAVFALGGALGWHFRGKLPAAPKAEPPTAEEERRLRLEQEAFRQLQNYNAETAYGLYEGRAGR